MAVPAELQRMDIGVVSHRIADLSMVTPVPELNGVVAGEGDHAAVGTELRGTGSSTIGAAAAHLEIAR